MGAHDAGGWKPLLQNQPIAREGGEEEQAGAKHDGSSSRDPDPLSRATFTNVHDCTCTVGYLAFMVSGYGVNMYRQHKASI